MNIYLCIYRHIYIYTSLTYSFPASPEGSIEGNESELVHFNTGGSNDVIDLVPARKLSHHVGAY
jgi:hypothetical protein